MICMLFPKLLASVFISGDEEVPGMTLKGLFLHSLGFLLGYNLICSIALQSAAKSPHAFVVALSQGMIMRIPLLLTQ